MSETNTTVHRYVFGLGKVLSTERGKCEVCGEEGPLRAPVGLPSEGMADGRLRNFAAIEAGGIVLAQLIYTKSAGLPAPFLVRTTMQSSRTQFGTMNSRRRVR
jgi:hypothetical protein